MSIYRHEGIAIADSYAASIDYTLDILAQQFDVVTKNTGIVDEAIPLDDRKAMLDEAAETSLFMDFSIASNTGKTYKGTDISERDYFQQAVATQGAYMSSPLLRKTSQTVAFMMGKYFTVNGVSYVVYGALDENSVTIHSQKEEGRDRVVSASNLHGYRAAIYTALLLPRISSTV